MNVTTAEGHTLAEFAYGSRNRLGQAVRRNTWPLATAVVTFGLVCLRTAAAMAVGPRWDSFSFLANAAAIAGRSFGYAEPTRPPLISLLAAPAMLVFPTDERVIQVADAMLTLIGLVGFWLLVRRRLSQAESSLATVALLASPIVWDWVGIGYTDFAGIGLCAWTLLLFVKATEESSRWYLAGFPMLLACALMRSSAVLFVLTVGIWLVLRARPFKDASMIARGVGLAVLAYVPFAVIYVRLAGDPLYPFMASRAIRDAGAHSGFVPQVETYLSSLPSLAMPSRMATITLLLLVLVVAGLAWLVACQLYRTRPAAGRVLLASTLVVVGALLVREVGALTAQALIALCVIAVWRLVASTEIDAASGPYRIVSARYALDAATLVWLLSFWWFHEQWAQQFTRYYVTMAPGVVYFGALGWRGCTHALVGLWEMRGPRRQRALRLSLAGAGALVAVAVIANVAATSWTPDSELLAARQTAAWVAARADADTVVYSDDWPITAWYMQREVRAMPLFADEAAVGHELDKHRAEYFVSTDDRPVAGYRQAFEAGGIRVLASSTAGGSKPTEGDRDILYLGRGWENYLERLGRYDFRLWHEEGDYDSEGSVFMDAYPPAELARWDTLAIYGVRWHERASAERAIEQYVRDGGTLLIDASRSLAEPYSLEGSVLFDTVIARHEIARDARITVDAAFASRHSLVSGDSGLDSAPFVDEDGSPWYGASYLQLPGSEPLRVLARIDGRPLIAERIWGHGRVVWVGGNLFWHAHLTQSPAEAGLVRAILDEVLEPTYTAETPKDASGS